MQYSVVSATNVVDFEHRLNQWMFFSLPREIRSVRKIVYLIRGECVRVVVTDMIITTSTGV